MKKTYILIMFIIVSIIACSINVYAVTDAISLDTGWTNGSDTYEVGVIIVSNIAILNLTEVRVQSGVVASKIDIHNNSNNGTLLGSFTVTNNYATPKFLLYRGTSYSIDANITTRAYKDAGGNYTVKKVNVNFTSQSDPGLGTTYFYNILSVNTTDVSPPIIPSISFVNPTPTNNTIQYYTQSNLTLTTVASNFGGTVQTNISIYKENGQLYQTVSNSSANYIYTFTLNTTDRYYFNATAYNSTISNFTDTRLFTLYNITVGSITIPSNNSNVSQYLTVNWSNATTTNSSVAITGFKLYLLNADQSYNSTLSTVTGLNFSNYDVYLNNLSIGSFYLLVEYTDAQGRSINSSTVRFNHLTNSLLNITAQQYNGTNIYSFSLNVNGALYNSSGGLVQTDIVKGVVYNIFINTIGFVTQNLSLTFNNSFNSYVFNTLYPNASLFISIFDESTLNLITQNITITLTDISNPSILYASTLNGNVTFLNLHGGDTYEVKFSSMNYTSNRYYRTVVQTLYDRLNAYLLPNGLNQSVSMCFYNTNGVYIPNLHVYQSLLSNGGYLITQDMFTDINGKTIFVFNPSTYYHYTWNSTEYALAFFNLNPPLNSQVLADGCNYDITLVSSTSTPSYSTIAVSGDASLNNVTHIITLTYTSQNSSFGNYYLNVYKTTNGVNLLICNNSNAAMVGSITCNVTGYVGQVFVQGTADGHIFYGSWMDLGNPSSFANVLSTMDAAFICGLIMLVVACGGLAFGVFGAGVGGVVGMIAIFWLGMFTPVTATIVIVDTIITIVILTSLKPRGS